MTKSHSDQPLQDKDQLVSEELSNLYMTLPEVMAHFRVSSNNTIQRWIKSGGFPEPTKFGGVLRWDAASIARWAATRHGGYKPK